MPTPPRSIASVAARGKRLEILRALRGRLARELDATKAARDVVALTFQLRGVLAEIAELEKQLPQPKGTPLDELEKRRATRPARKGAAGTARTARGRQSR